MKTIRLVLYFVVGLLLGGWFTLSHAGNFQSYQGSAFRTINGTTYWKGDAGSFAASKATVLESVKVGGTYITVPTFAQVTGSAVSVALAAVRASPGIAGASLIAWLASQGMQYIDGQWKAKGPSVPVQSYDSPDLPVCSPDWQNCNIQTERYCRSNSGSTYFVNGVVPTATKNSLTASGWTWLGNCTDFHTVMSPSRGEAYNPCGNGYTYNSSDGSCHPVDYVTAGQSDWDRVNGVTPPDDVMREMCQALAKYNTSTPGCAMYNAKTEKASVAMSDWAPNPTTGKDERQVATWTPRPTPEDPFAGEVSVRTESKDASAPTDPATGNTTDPADTSSQDSTKDTPFCTLYPESLACAKMGTPEEADKLESKTMGVESITIQTFGSSATCPAPIPLPHGSELSFEWPCRMEEGVKPFLLALAWLAAGLIVIGAMRND